MGECLIIRSGGGTDTSNANATAGKVLSGYTCYVKDTKITGTMTNRGTVNQSLNPGGSYTIPVGYHSGSGKVTVSSLSANTSGTANAGRILSGRTAWVGGSRLTGTMTNRGAVSQSLAANGLYTIPAGWHNGSGKVNQSLTTQGAKSVTPKTTNQTACSANRWTTGTITIVGSSSLTAGNIKNGVWIFGVKGTFTGWVDSTMPPSIFTGSNKLRVDGSAQPSQGDTFSNHWTFDHSTQMNKIINAGFNWIRVDAHGYVNVGDSTSSGNAYVQVQGRYYNTSSGISSWIRHSIGDRDWYYVDGDGGTRTIDVRSTIDFPLKHPDNGNWMWWLLVFLEVPKRYMWGYTEVTNGWFRK